MVAGAAIGALGNIFGGLLSNAVSTQSMMDLAGYQAALNWSYAKKNARNMPSLNREGLEKAGYNPMLALSNLSGAQTNWSSLANPTSPDMSEIGGNAVSNALAIQQQKNNNAMTESQVSVNNADSVLKTNQAVTEMYSQLEKLNHADLMQAQKILTDKDVSWYDKKQAREDLRVANEIERTGNDFKVGMAQAIASQISANANMIGQSANATAVNIENEKNKNYYLGKLPKKGKFQQYLYNVGKGLSDFTGLGRLSLPRH